MNELSVVTAVLVLLQSTVFPYISLRVSAYPETDEIPLYISQIKVLFLNILGLNGADGISSVSGYADTLNEIYGKTVDWRIQAQL